MALFALLRVLAWGVARLPYAWLRAPGAVLGLAAGSVLRIRRAHVEGAMRAAGVALPARSARAMYRGLGAGVMELLWSASRRRELSSVARVDEASRQALLRAKLRGRGVVFAASHTGNWELAACALAREIPLTIVAKPLAARGFEAFSGLLRGLYGVKVAHPGSMLGPATSALARGEAVALMVDQVPERSRHALTASFLAREALLDRAAAALAACTGATLLVAATRRGPDGKHTLHVLTSLEPPQADRRAWIEHATREATRALERFVREHPADWLWLHRRWRAPLESIQPGAAACLSPGASLNEPGHAA